MRFHEDGAEFPEGRQVGARRAADVDRLIGHG